MKEYLNGGAGGVYALILQVRGHGVVVPNHHKRKQENYPPSVFAMLPEVADCENAIILKVSSNLMM